MLETLLAQALNGLVLGFLYVLIAIGLSIVFGILGIVNMAHGAFFALGAYIAITLQREFGWAAVVLAPFIVAALGMLFEAALLRRLYGKEPLMVLVLTFAFGLLVEAAIGAIWGTGGEPMAPPPILSGVMELGPVLVTNYRLAVLGITVMTLLALWAFLSFTPYGRVLRAGARDPQMVGMLGINLPIVLTGAVGFGCLLAGTAGILAAPLWTVTPSMASLAVMPAFVIVTIGGLGSYLGVVIAGLLVGLTTALTIQFFPQAASAAIYVLMAVILLFRPRGLLGESEAH